MSENNSQNENQSTASVNGREMIISRLINAPRKLVWEAFTKPEHLINWWGPNGFTNTFKEINIQPGGLWLFTMHGPDGTDYPNRILFKEVIAPEKMSYTHGDDKDYEQFETTITLEVQGNKTLVTLKATFKSAEILKQNVEKYGALEGGKQTLGRLDAYVQKIGA